MDITVKTICKLCFFVMPKHSLSSLGEADDRIWIELGQLDVMCNCFTEQNRIKEFAYTIKELANDILLIGNSVRNIIF
jgi:hypothetical protein